MAAGGHLIEHEKAAGSVLGLAFVRFFYWGKLMEQNTETVQEKPIEYSRNGSGPNGEFCRDAWLFYEKSCEDFSQILLRQAGFQADQRKDRRIIKQDIHRALAIMEEREQSRLSSREYAKVIGGALFGVFCSGFIFELATGPTYWVGVYTVAGFVGLALVWWGHRR